jgi:glycosyltransferase involved in cell wall biosynthesis
MMSKTLPRVLHISFARKYDASLFPTWKKKFALLTDISENYVVQGIRTGKFRSSHEFVHAYYIPCWLPRYLQYAVDCFIAFIAVLYFATRRGVAIVISHDPYVAIPVLFGKWILRGFGKSIVVVVEALGDWEEAPFLDGFLPRSLKNLSKLADFAFKYADVTRAISSFTEAKIKKITTKPCLTTPVYLDLSLFFEESDPLLPPANGQQILYAGVLSFRKGVHILVQAFTQLAPRYLDATLLIIGEGQYREEIVRLIQVSGVEERIRLMPFVSQRELKRYIDSCAMVVLPSFSEGLGRILLEAMTCGRPVIVSAIDVVKELITDRWNGLLVKPGDAQALAEQIETLLKEPELAEKLVANGKQLVQEHHSEAAFVRGYKALMEMAIQQLPANVRRPFLDEDGCQC